MLRGDPSILIDATIRARLVRERGARSEAEDPFGVNQVSDDFDRAPFVRAGSPLKIVAELKKATREKLAMASLGRYASKHAQMMERLREVQEEAGAIVGEIKAGSLNASEMATALVARALFEAKDRLQNADPVKLSREERERQKLDLKRVELGLRQQEIDLNKQRFGAMERRLEQIREKAKKAMEKPSGKLTPETVAEIRDIYGLAEES